MDNYPGDNYPKGNYPVGQLLPWYNYPAAISLLFKFVNAFEKNSFLLMFNWNREAHIARCVGRV